MIDPKQQLEAMNSSHVLEAALMVVPKFLDVDDPQDTLARVASLAKLGPEEGAEIDALARKAAEESTREIASMLKLVLLDLASREDDAGENVARQLEAVGHKQVVIDPSFYYIGALLIAGYMAFCAQGRLRTKRTETIEEQKDGRKKVTIAEETIFLNPFNPLAGMLERITKGSS
jgi:hypothetical protein